MKPITKPGIHDISAEEYHADPTPAPSLSSSIAKLLLSKCPRHAWHQHPRLNKGYEGKTSDKFDLGSAAHAMTLNDDRLFEIIDAKDYKTNAAKDQRDKARAAGKIPLLTEQYNRTREMVAAGKPQFARLEGGNPFTAGKAEQTLIWEENGLWLRCRLDWLRDARDVWADFKWTETSANPDDLTRHIFNMGYDIQAAFYCRGIRALKLDDEPERRWRFYFQEEAEPFLVSPPMAFAPRAQELAHHKVERAIAIWRRCLAENDWPAYPTHTCHVEPPGWHETQYLERAERDDHIARTRGKPSAKAMKTARDFQSPHNLGAD